MLDTWLCLEGWRGFRLAAMWPFIFKSLYSVIRDENASKQCFGEGRSSECRVEGRVWMKTLLIISFFHLCMEGNWKMYNLL